MTEETPAYQPDQAFNDARAGFQLGDIELFPNTTQRKFAADRMGMKWGSIRRDDPMIESGRYAGALRDVAILLWLCVTPRRAELKPSSPADAWTVERADRTPDDAYEAAQTWAESIGLTDTTSDAFAKAWSVFLKIKRGEEVSRFRVTTDVQGGPPEHEPGNSSGPQSGPNSSQESPALPDTA